MKITANIIGYAVKSELREINISNDMIKEAIKKFNLPDYAFTITQKGSVIRAAKEVAKTNKRFKDHLARRVRDDSQFVMSIIDESKDAENDTLTYNQTTTIKLEKLNGKIDINGPMQEEFMHVYEKYQNSMTTNDLRAYIYKVLRKECGAVSIIHTGGLYFVPADKLSIVEKLNEFVKELNLGRIWYKPEIDDPITREWVWNAAVEEITGMVDDLMKYMQKDVKFREKTLHDKGTSLIEKTDLIKMYANLTEFGSQAEVVIASINDAINQVASKIKEIN